MPESQEAEQTTTLRRPTAADAAAIWQLVRQSGVLDVNSPYLYLLLCRDFSATCVIAERGARVIGFTSAYRVPERPEVLFVWQIGVDPSARRQGLGRRMLHELIADVRAGSKVRWVEATVSPSNHASRGLFRSLAAELDATVTWGEGFSEADFPSDDHEAEPLIRIELHHGPGNRERGLS